MLNSPTETHKHMMFICKKALYPDDLEYRASVYIRGGGGSRKVIKEIGTPPLPAPLRPPVELNYTFGGHVQWPRSYVSENGTAVIRKSPVR